MVSFRVGSKLCGYCSKVPRRHRRLTAPPDPAQCQKCHAWHGKRKWMSASATPATQSAAASQAPNGPGSPPEPAQCHACHVKCACRQVPRLPRKVPRRHGRLTATKHATRPNPLPEVPCLRRKNKDGCPQVPRHVKRRWISPSATPAMQSAAASRATNGDQARHQSQPSATSATSATLARQNEVGCAQVPRLPRQTKVDVSKCHACHAKCRGVRGG